MFSTRPYSTLVELKFPYSFQRLTHCEHADCHARICRSPATTKFVNDAKHLAVFAVKRIGETASNP
jgi:hypothetical protein